LKIFKYQLIIFKLKKLIKDKEIIIPDFKEEEQKPRAFNPHEFVRNVMGKDLMKIKN
jgi:hypothetical protein